MTTNTTTYTYIRAQVRTYKNTPHTYIHTHAYIYIYVLAYTLNNQKNDTKCDRNCRAKKCGGKRGKEKQQAGKVVEERGCMDSKVEGVVSCQVSNSYGVKIIERTNE